MHAAVGQFESADRRLSPVATAWEYKEVSSHASERDHDTEAKAFAAVADHWFSRLNKLGAEGWELVSEIHAEAPDRPGTAYWFARYGTMKRPRLR
jgi:hypothetical protein